MNDNASIHYISSLYTLKEMKKLVTIALKAHGNNPSLVDIKVELSDLDADNLMRMEEDLNQIINANEIKV